MTGKPYRLLVCALLACVASLAGAQAKFIEPPALAAINDPDDLGMTAVMRGKVRASERWRIAGEIRRRLNRAFVADGIELNKRGVTTSLRRGPDLDASAADPDGALDG